MSANHGLTKPASPEGVRIADALCLDAIEDGLGQVCAFADLAREHARINDLAGLEYSLKVVRAHFKFAAEAFVDIRERHDAARSKNMQAQSEQANLEREFA